MAGYIGTKAVLLSTTAASVTGNADIGGNLTVDTSTLFVDSTNNRVGIGTNSPTAIVTVQKDGDVFHAQSAASSAPRIGMFTNSSAGTVGLFASRTDTIGFPAMTFSTSDTERMRIDASGNLFVGGVNFPNITGGGGLGFSPDAQSSQLGIGHNASGTSGTYYVYFTHAGSIIGSIAQSGTTGVAYNTSSDYRLKEDVQPMVGASDRVLALNPVNFAWKADGTRVDGFLAHEAQAVVPEAVTGTKDAMRTEEYEVTPAVEATYDEDGNELTPYVPAVMGTREVPDYQGIDQSKLTPLLTAALQEALNEIAALKDRVAALEAV